MANRNLQFGDFDETPFPEHDGIDLPGQSISTAGTNSFYQHHSEYSTTDYQLARPSAEAPDDLYQSIHGMEPSANQPWSALGQLNHSQSFHDNQVPVFDPQSGFYDISALGIPDAQWEDPAPQYSDERRAELLNGIVNPEVFELDHQSSTSALQQTFESGMASDGSSQLPAFATNPQAESTASGDYYGTSMAPPSLTPPSHQRYNRSREVAVSGQQHTFHSRRSWSPARDTTAINMHGQGSRPGRQGGVISGRCRARLPSTPSVTQADTAAPVSAARLRQPTSHAVRPTPRFQQRHDSVITQQSARLSNYDTTDLRQQAENNTAGSTLRDRSAHLKRKASNAPAVQQAYKRSKLGDASSVESLGSSVADEDELRLATDIEMALNPNAQGINAPAHYNTPSQRYEQTVINDEVGAGTISTDSPIEDAQAISETDIHSGKSLKTVVQEEFQVDIDEVEAVVEVINNQGSITEDNEFPTAEEALAHLDGTGPGTTWHKPHIDDDDFELLDKAEIKQELQERLMSALTEDFLPEQRACSDFHKAHIKKKHEERFAWVKNQIAENPADTRARIALVIEAVIHLHRDGIPSSRLDLRRHKEADIEADILSKYPVKTAAGRIADITTPCIARVLNIVKAAKHNKSFAYDLLKGYRVEDYYEVVIATQSCFSQKLSNAMSNAERAFQAEKVARNKGKEPEKKNTKSSIKKPANKRGRKGAKAKQVLDDSDEEGLDE